MNLISVLTNPSQTFC